MAKLARTLELMCSAETFYQQLLDFSAYPSFLSNIKSVDILHQDQHEALVLFRIDLLQTFEAKLHFVFEPNKKISWTLEESEMLKAYEGSWTLSQKGKKLLASYEVNFELKLWMPQLMLQSLIDASLPKMLNEFKRHAEQK